DEFLIKPFSDQDLRQTVRRALTARRESPRLARVTEDGEQKLTSRDIFGDVLAEVEGDLGQAAPPVAMPAATAADRAEIERKLEQTLSGMLGPAIPKPKPPPAPEAASPVSPAAKRASELAASDVEALLSKTLSSLHIGGKASAPARVAAAGPSAPAASPRPPAPASPAPAAQSPVAVPPSVPPPAPPPAAAKPSEGTGIRSRADLDLAAIEQMARTVRPAAPAVPPRAPAVSPPAAASSPPRPAPPADAPNPATTQRIPVLRESAEGNFGQYTLLERIAVGGMAEVWKARMRGLEGFQKTVAIKRILGHMTHNSEFVG